MTLCLNMIVRNEMANLERCLSAVAPHVDCWVIGDTGSSDGTQSYIQSFFAARGIPGELHSFPFVNFEQARNTALDHARDTSLAYSYLLLADADMELVVEDPAFAERLSAPGYRLIQRADSGLTYWNTRLVRRGIGARYHGVTHEYIDIPGGVEPLAGAWYKDHATGSNRRDKFERDIRLLSEALEREPGNNRYWFYLAQSYRDAGQIAKAAEAYAKRADMGGWEEEAWYARLQEARCLLNLGDEPAFLRQMMRAYNQRPQRAETLYELARFHRERSLFDASILFSEPGLGARRPDEDILFLEDFVYAAGLKEEFSIAANYARSPERKDRGFATCDWLASSRLVPSPSRDLARSNLYFYLRPARDEMPSFRASRVAFAPPVGLHALGASIATRGNDVAMLVRAGNGNPGDDGLHRADGGMLEIRDFLIALGDDLDVRSVVEISSAKPRSDVARTLGCDDGKLFFWRDGWWCSSGVEQADANRVSLLRIDTDRAAAQYRDERILQPVGSGDGTNGWMPVVDGGDLRFVARCDPTRILDDRGGVVSETSPARSAEQYRGATPAIAFESGWLAMVREPSGASPRDVQHRLVWFDRSLALWQISRPFFFDEKGPERAAGLCRHPNGRDMLVTYVDKERAIWLASVTADDIRGFLDRSAQLPFEADGAGQGELKAASAESDAIGASLAHQDNPRKVIADMTAGNLAGRVDRRRGTPGRTTAEVFRELAPFLERVDVARDRREQSRDFDRRMARCLDPGEGGSLPQIHCFYEVLSPAGNHDGLVAATRSMMMAGHRVKLWSYTPSRLEGLVHRGIDLGDASEVMPRPLFERVVARSEIRFFSDLFRYAVLYEHGGLWLDTDVVMLRPFPFRGDYFFNLQWRHGDKGHFVCGNALYAKACSRHMRRLYEQALQRFFAGDGLEFGDVGPKLLSDYIASEAGAELRPWLFSPMFFNAIDWTESDLFRRSTEGLEEYLNDDRVIGIHLWNARTHAASRDRDTSLLAALSDPRGPVPSLVRLADEFDTDKNRHTGNAHGYARVYERLLGERRLALRRLMEVGLSDKQGKSVPSVELWQAYFPFCHVIGVDVRDFSGLNSSRFTAHVCDPSRREDLRRLVRTVQAGSLDVIIDDGSHASADQQMTLVELFPLLAHDGWYFIEDLDWQPPGEDVTRVAPSKDLLREIQESGAARSVDPFGVAALAGQFAEILFFDSHYELSRATLMGGLVAIRKAGSRAK
ncbi:MAG: glycosyltransferase [Reyranellaceae bacterium]